MSDEGKISMGVNKREHLKALGEVIRARRRVLDLTQTELGARIGYSQERISLLENGTYGMPSVPRLADLAGALELSLADLLAAAGYLVPIGRDTPARPTGEVLARQGIRRLRQEKERLVNQFGDLQRQLAVIEQGMQSVEDLRSQVQSNRVRMEELVRTCRTSLL